MITASRHDKYSLALLHFLAAAPAAPASAPAVTSESFSADDEFSSEIRNGGTGEISGKFPDHLIFGFAIGSNENEDDVLGSVSVAAVVVSDDDVDDCFFVAVSISDALIKVVRFVLWGLLLVQKKRKCGIDRSRTSDELSYSCYCTVHTRVYGKDEDELKPKNFSSKFLSAKRGSETFLRDTLRKNTRVDVLFCDGEEKRERE